jgi:hypothetical protein
MTILADKFEKIPIKKLPKDTVPKFKIGDLVYAEPGSPNHAFGFYIKEGMGVISEVVAYKVFGFDYYSPQPIYMIEYKVKWAGKDDSGYVLEQYLKLVDSDV